jgi:hypothetical protein
MFRFDESGGDVARNLPAGTVIDTGPLVDRDRNEFFLCSQVGQV